MNPISALSTAPTPALFPPLHPPRIYAYADAQFPNCLKMGFTARTVAERMAEHHPTNLPQQTQTVVLDEIATRQGGNAFSDHGVHRVRAHGLRGIIVLTWFVVRRERTRCGVV